MLDVYTVSFFGHRYFYPNKRIEEKTTDIIKELLRTKEFVEFLVGRNGEFDIFVSSIIRTIKREYDDNNSALILVLPYSTSEYINNQDGFENYYDEIEICEKSSMAHFKAAIQTRNREMVDRSELIISYIDKVSGGAYNTIKYAERQNKNIINIAEIVKEWKIHTDIKCLLYVCKVEVVL